MVSQLSWQSIIFDLDGTLIDSAQTILAIINEMRMTRAADCIMLEDIRPHLSKGGRSLVAESLGACARHEDEDLCDFRSRYAKRRQGPELLFPYVVETLDGLAARGFRLAMCTNKPSLLAHAALRGTGLERHFEAVVAGDDVKVHKPCPEPLLLTAERLCLEPAKCLYVGDSEVDAVAAGLADMDFVLATYGYPVGCCSEVKAIARIKCLDQLQNLLTAGLSVSPVKRFAS